MKKLIAALMMAVMLVGTALAVDSPVADTGVEVLEGGIIITTNNSQEAADTVNAAAIKFVGENEQIILVDAYLYGNATLPITVKLKIAAAAGKKVTTLHYGKDGWEEVSAAQTDADGIFEVTFTDLSPVAFVFDKAASDNKPSDSGKTDNKADSGSSSQTVADKTGEPAVMAIVSLVAVSAFAGMVVTRRKEN